MAFKVCVWNIYLHCNILCFHVDLIFSWPTEAVKDPTRIKTDDSTTSDSGTTIKIIFVYCTRWAYTLLIANSWQSSSSLLQRSSSYLNSSWHAHRNEEDHSNSLTVSELGNRQKSSIYTTNATNIVIHLIYYILAEKDSLKMFHHICNDTNYFDICYCCWHNVNDKVSFTFIRIY